VATVAVVLEELENIHQAEPIHSTYMQQMELMVRVAVAVAPLKMELSRIP
jgi:hypothetical protein